MAEQTGRAQVVTVSPVAAGLAWVYGRVVAATDGERESWEYLGSSASREEALERARRTAGGGEVRIDEDVPGSAALSGIAPTRPPADS